jgi:hypothetical protein
MALILGLSHQERYRLRVFENRVLRRIFAPKTEEVPGVWRRLHKEEIRNLYTTSPDVIRAIKSRRMQRARYVVSM